MRRLLAAARAGQVPVIWSEVQYSRPDMADAGLFWRKAKVLDVWLKGDSRGLAHYVDGLEPQQGDVVVVKKYASAFFGTSLASELQVRLSPLEQSDVAYRANLVFERRHTHNMWGEHFRLCESDYLGRHAAWFQTNGESSYLVW